MVIIGDPFRRVSVAGGNYMSGIFNRHNPERQKSDFMVHSQSASENLLEAAVEDQSLTGLRGEPDEASVEDVDVTFEMDREERLQSCNKLLASTNVVPKFLHSKSP